MDSTSEQMRARIARIGSRIRRRGLGRKQRSTLTALLATGIAMAVLSAGGTTALWTGSVQVSPGTVTAGSAHASLGGFTDLATTFTSNQLSKTSYLKLANTGTTDATYTAAISTTGSSALASSTTVTVWFASSPTECTETAVPSYATTVAWNAFPQTNGTLPAGVTGYNCLRTRTAASNLLTTASFTANLIVTLTVPGTRWTSSATASAVQQVAPDAAQVGNDYTDAVRADGAGHFWRLGESSGRVLYDLVGTDDAYAGTGLTRGAAGALTADPNAATTFSGDSNGTAITRNLVTNPQTFGLEAWFKTTTTTGGKIIGFGDSSTGLSPNYDRQIYLDAQGHVFFGTWTGSASTVWTTGTYNDNNWHHVVGNLSSAGLSLYVDGALIGTNAATSAQQYNGYWHIGGDWTWSGDSYFDGTIDEVAVYGAPLSASSVSNHYKLSGRSGIPAGVGDRYGSTVYGDAPTLYWRLGESSGTSAVDSSPSGTNTGTYSGSVTKPITGALPNTRNSAASFGGTDGLVATKTAVTAPSVFSTELWFNTTTTAGGKLIGFGNAASGSSSNYDRHVWLDTAGKLNFGAYNGTAVTITSANPYNNGQWHHVVATLGSGGMTLYVDGSVVAQNANTVAEGNTGYWRVGGDSTWNGAQYVNAKIDEVAVYSTVLSESQVKRHYAMVSGAPAAAITAATISGQTGSFDGSTSTDYDGSIAGYSWNFGDNTAATTGPKATHTYAAPGTYTVTLTVTDNAGKTSSTTVQVTIADTTPPTAPGQPTVTAYTDTTVSLSWPAATDNVRVAGYGVYRNGVLVGTTTTTTYTDTGLTADTAYTYKVAAGDAVRNQGPDSPTVNARTVAFSTTTYYQVQNQGSAKCLTGGGTTDQSSLAQYTCDTTLATQAFRLIPTGSGSFQVQMKMPVTAKTTTPVSWDVAGASTADYGQVYLSTYNATSNQQWTPTKQSDGTYTFTAVNSGKCLDVNGRSTADGVNMQQYTCSADNPAQKFSLVAVS